MAGDIRKKFFSFRGYEYGMRFRRFDKWDDERGITGRSRFFVGFGIGARFRTGVSNAVYNIVNKRDGNYTELFIGPYKIIFYKIADKWK